MPILASNFTANSLQGTVTVTGGQANIVLPLSNFAFEGTKTFVVDLRKEGFSGTVMASSDTITIPDTTTIVSLTSNVSSNLNEGSAITYTLTTTNVTNGTNVYYSTNSIVNATFGSGDIVGGNIGIITINNNVGTLTLVANADNATESTESFTLQIRAANTAGNIVYTSANTITVFDTSNAEVTASGGNDTFTFAGYKYHVFLSSNNFTISNPVSSAVTVDLLAVAGGGSGGGHGAPAR